MTACSSLSRRNYLVMLQENGNMPTRGWTQQLKVRLRSAFPAGAAAWLRLKEARQRRASGPNHLRDAFSAIYEGNLWGNAESLSGHGSTLAETEALRSQLPALLRELEVRSFLDCGCGDCHWIQHTTMAENIRYLGVDVVPALIEHNRQRFSDRGWLFEVADASSDALPHADLILSRDCWIHLSFHYIHASLANFRRTGARYLLTTTYRGLPANREMLTGQWRPLDLQLAPFHLPPPQRFLRESECEVDGRLLVRGLGLWRLAELPYRR